MLVETFVFGLLIGSFLNVCIYRIPRHESIVFPGSHCTSCGAPIKPYDLIPVVSYLLLHGKCRSCKSPISIRYPIVELVTAVLITGQAWKRGLSIEFFMFATLTTILIVIAMVDIDLQLIPDGFNLTVAALGVFYLLGVRMHQVGFSALLDGIMGSALGAGLFLLISVISKGGMGGGDIKLVAALGLWFGWKGLLLLLFIAFVVGAIVSVLLLLLRRKGRKDGIPFGPFLAFAAYLVSLFGTDLLQWYFQFSIH